MVFHACSTGPLVARQSGFMRGGVVQRVGGICQVRSRAVCAVSAKYRGVNTDLSRLPEFKIHENDCGSPQYQIARLSARVTQLTTHLQTYKKDSACERGLRRILTRRKKLLKYLYDNDRDEFHRVIKDLGLRFSAKRFTTG